MRLVVSSVMAAKIQMLCVGILLLVRIGVAQDCRLTHTLGSGPGGGFTPIDVNITDTPSCFVCPATAGSFSLNGQTLTNAPPDVVIDSTTVSIYNWSAVPLNLPTVNMIACTDGVGFTSTTFFFSLIAPEVSTNSLLATTVDVGGRLVLDCSYVGVPEADVTWTLNSSVLNSAVNSGISISTMTTASSMTTTLTWTNVPVDAQGTYYCVFVNAAGSRNGSYTIHIATTPEPAINFRVTATTSTTMSLAWDKQFDGLLTITGGVLEYFTGGGSSPADMTMSGTTATLTSLTPFAFYNVILFVTNRLGRSAPVSLVQQTDSNFLEAPAVTLTAVSSTELLLDWTSPASSPLVETAANWMVEFSLSNGSDLQRETVVASVLTRLFQHLSKGTEYRARVAGSNSRGMGTFSGYQTMETLVDLSSINMGVSTSTFVMGILLTFLLTVISYSAVLLLVLIVVRKYRSHSSRKVVNTLPSEEYYEYIAESPNTITQQHTFEDKLKVESCAAYGVINEMKVMSPRESEETL